jgi:hypothetical protein
MLHQILALSIQPEEPRVTTAGPRWRGKIGLRRWHRQERNNQQGGLTLVSFGLGGVEHFGIAVVFCRPGLL